MVKIPDNLDILSPFLSLTILKSKEKENKLLFIFLIIKTM